MARRLVTIGTLLLSAGLVALVLYIVVSVSSLQHAPEQQLLHAAYGLDKDFDRLHAQLRLPDATTPQMRHEAGRLFEALQSDAAALPAIPIGEGTVKQELDGFLARLAPLIANLTAGDATALPAAHAELDRGEDIIDRYLLVAVDWSQQLSEDWRAQLERVFLFSTLSFSVLTAAVLVALLVLVRQRARMRRDGERLRQTARELREAQRIARIGTFRWDFKADRVSWSDELAEIFGIGRGETMSGAQFQRLVHPDDVAMLEAMEDEAARRATQTGQPAPRDVQYRVVRPDGVTIYVEAAAEIEANAQGRRLMASVVRDVTTEFVQKQALLDSEQSLAEAQRIAKLGSFRIDLVTNQSYWSDEMYRITGRRRDAETLLQRADPRDLVHPDDLPGVTARMEAALAMPVPGGTRQLPLQHRLLWQDGTIRHVRGMAEYRYGPDGRPLTLTGTLQDVTESVAQEQAVLDARAEAERASAAKSEFLAVMSHELRTPMNGVLGMLSALDDTTLDAEQRSLVSVARSSADSLLVLLNDILDMSKIEAGRLELETTTFELHPLLRSVVHLYVEQARSKGITLDSQIAADVPPWLSGDAGRLRQVVLNFVSNAVKFTGTGGVLIRAGLAAPLRDDQARLRVEVCDSGIGIAKEKQHEVFAPFNQLDRSYARRFGGTGLGLAISRRLSELMGGTVGFTSQAGQGTTFWIEVPLRIGAPGATSPVDDGAPLPEMKLLVAEDNATNQLVARRLLERLGHRVDVVSNGVEALEAVRTHVYDAVLMDLSMPQMDGIEATLKIRALPGRIGKVPIIALSANAMDVDVQASRQAGMTGFVSKPIAQAKLIEALREALHQASATKGASLEALPPPGDDIDPAKLAVLEKQIGPENMPELLLAYQTDIRRALSELAGGAAAQDAKTFRRGAHSLRSITLNLGEGPFAAEAGRIERLADDPDLDRNQAYENLAAHAATFLARIVQLQQKYESNAV